MGRNQYMVLGTALLLLGITIFKVDNVTLTKASTKFVAQQMGSIPEGSPDLVPATPKTIVLPPWLRFAFLCVGAVLIAHAVAMKPAG